MKVYLKYGLIGLFKFYYSNDWREMSWHFRQAFATYLNSTIVTTEAYYHGLPKIDRQNLNSTIVTTEVNLNSHFVDFNKDLNSTIVTTEVRLLEKISDVFVHLNSTIVTTEVIRLD